MDKKIVVVGSSNTDMVVQSQYFPLPGETVLGGDFFIFQGGKGANQAVAASRLGGNITFICKVGNDVFGNNAIEHYRKEGINTTSIIKDENTPTGIALITVNKEGENTIVVASGANGLLTADNVMGFKEVLHDASYIITQLETPLPTIQYLASFAKAYNKNLVLNPAPAASLPLTVLSGLFLITPNETETEILTGIKVTDEASAQKAVDELKFKGVQNVIITLGSRGAYVSCESFEGAIPSHKVDAVDSTAAGDVFNGALVVALANNKPWKDAVEFACRAAAISVTKMGAQSSAPYLEEITPST